MTSREGAPACDASHGANQMSALEIFGAGSPHTTFTTASFINIRNQLTRMANFEITVGRGMEALQAESSYEQQQ
jgi:hypothetical protein